ncbi:hypothetical protein [Brevibacillus choshinensis]|uniref:hypothetical protein n=1 Tax=Brevibacillus choshinensis TaxID=54911 RepID=UPI002E21701B|nr:hypothetical protein [Brevibacillus choshinensis]
MTIVNVVDAPCGFGKTSWAIQYMNAVPEDTYKFIYVTPSLSETERIKKSVTSRQFYDPHDDNGDTKLDHLHRLLAEGKDICTTHALFKTANTETRELLRINNYILILDEVMNVVEQVKLTNHDLKILFDSRAIYKHEDDKGLVYIRWSEDKLDYDSKYNGIKRMALTNNVMYCDSSALIWTFPCEVFSLFKDVYILTYLFRGQLQKYYFDLHGIRYRYLSVTNHNDSYSLVPYNLRKPMNKQIIKEKIEIYDGDLNKVGDNTYALSKSWFEKSKNAHFITVLKNTTRNYLMNKCKAKVDITLWTTFKGGDKDKIKKKVSPRSFAQSYIPVNERATNQHKDKYILAYLANRFMRNVERNFFTQYKVQVDEEVWALSELIQWIWRSAIRDGESVKIYIPSKRMRNLLKRYLDSDFFEQAPPNAIVDEFPSDWHL